MKPKSNFIIKRKGHFEKYDQKKVYASVYSAALNCHLLEKESEKIALDMSKKVTKLASKKPLDSKEIKQFVIENLEDKQIALMYKHHLDLC